MRDSIDGMAKPSVSIVIPVLNEQKYIRSCLDSVLLQDYPSDKLEVILAVGPCVDDTEKIIAEYCAQYSYIKTVKNPRGTISCGVNLAIKAAKGEYIVRFDAHSEFARDYVSKCIEYHLKTGADNVGGPTVVRGKNAVGRAVAAAYYSPFALGGGKQHIANYEGYGDTVSFGSFKKSTAERVGLFDERLILNEDDDFNFKIAETGGKIFISSKIRSIYYPRDSYLGLIKQYYGYGHWKVAVIKKHKRPARISHLIPLAFVLFLLIFGTLSIVFPIVRWGYFCVLSLYLLLDVLASFTLKAEDRQDGIMLRLRLILIHFLLHISYGVGFLTGIFRFMFKKFELEYNIHEEQKNGV